MSDDLLTDNNSPETDSSPHKALVVVVVVMVASRTPGATCVPVSPKLEKLEGLNGLKR